MEGGRREEIEEDLDAKLRLEEAPEKGQNGRKNSIRRTPSIAFRAPQEQFSIRDFELGKIYGVGSYSKVVRAKKLDTGQVYALKIMDKKFITKENKIEYVKLERIVLDQLEHPGIIHLYFTFQDTYSIYMALESCDGGELFDQITRKGRLPEDEARFYAAEVVDALEYIHSVGIIHRDIKPENLLLTSDGHIKIADFGSVKPTKDNKITVLADVSSFDEKACTFVGTAAYIPPEVLNSSPPTFGNDLWALGCTIYQMLTGTSPFKDASEWLIFQRIIARDVKFPDYFSSEARDIVDKLLDPDPNKRPGAGPGGYDALKSHPFFRGIDWRDLRQSSAPKIVLDQNADREDDVQDGSWNLTHIGDVPSSQKGIQSGSSNTSSPESQSQIPAISSIDSFDSKWQEFLEPGESIIMISKVKKLNKLSRKKVQLILTNRPKLFCVDPSKLMSKPSVIWSEDPRDIVVNVSTSSHFKISTPKKSVSFKDSKERAWQWKSAIENFQTREKCCTDHNLACNLERDENV